MGTLQFVRKVRKVEGLGLFIFPVEESFHSIFGLYKKESLLDLKPIMSNIWYWAAFHEKILLHWVLGYGLSHCLGVALHSLVTE